MTQELAKRQRASHWRDRLLAIVEDVTEAERYEREYGEPMPYYLRALLPLVEPLDALVDRIEAESGIVRTARLPGLGSGPEWGRLGDTTRLTIIADPAMFAAMSALVTAAETFALAMAHPDSTQQERDEATAAFLEHVWSWPGRSVQPPPAPRTKGRKRRRKEGSARE